MTTSGAAELGVTSEVSVFSLMLSAVGMVVQTLGYSEILFFSGATYIYYMVMLSDSEAGRYSALATCYRG